MDEIPDALGSQLRAWRVRAGMREGRRLSQDAVSERAGRVFSVRWLKDLEGGRSVRPDHERIAALGRALGLSQAESDVLFIAVGLRSGHAVAAPDDATLRDLRVLVGRIPDPAMVTDALWAVHASNARFDAWLPSAAKRTYGGNLLRWLVFAPEAQSVFRGEWVGRVRAMVESIRITRLVVRDPGPLEALIAELREQPDFRQLWDSYPASELAPDRTKMHLAITGRQGTPGLIHVLRPVAAAGLRLVVITPPPDLPLRGALAPSAADRRSPRMREGPQRRGERFQHVPH